MKLYYKFASGIVFVTLLSILVLGILFSVYSTEVVKDRILDQLRSVSTLKENQLNNYIKNSEDDLEVLASDVLVVNYMEKFHEEESGSKEQVKTVSSKDIIELQTLAFSAIDNELFTLQNLSDGEHFEDMDLYFEAEISSHFSSLLNHSRFTSLSVLTTEGVVDLSTKPGEKGKIRSKEAYFINGLNSTYVQSFYLSIATQEPIITISTPIYGNKGEVVGILLGDLRLNQISELMVERSGLGDTGETIIINKNHLLVSEARFSPNSSFKKTIYTEGANQCLKGDDGAKEFKDYRDIKVIAFVTWIPEREICLVTKVDVKEAYASLNKLYLRLFIFVGMVLICSLILAFILSKKLSESMNMLIENTKKISRGDYDINKIESNDELGELSSSFVAMAHELKETKQSIEDINVNLEHEIKRKTQELSNKIEDLERFNKFAVERELKMIALKKEIDELNVRLGKEKRYKQDEIRE